MSSAIMPVSKELLTEFMNYLSEDTELMRIGESQDGMTIYFNVQHPDIPDGAVHVYPSFRTNYDENGKVVSIEFTGWNPR